MARSPFDGSPAWLPGAILIGAAVALGGVAGLAIGARAWPSYLGLSLGFLLLFGWFDRLREARPAAPPKRRTRLRVIQGGRPDYDLAEDRSTDEQKYVM